MLDFFISNAHANTEAAAAQGGFMNIFLLVGLVVIFWLMIWRPQAKRNKEHKNLISGLEKGDEVVTIGGMLGRVVDLSEDYVVLRVSEGVEMTFQKTTISSALPKGTLSSIKKTNA